IGADVVQERRLHLQVAALGVLAPSEILERVPDHHPLRVPERGAGRGLLQMEEVELPAKPAVITPPGFLQALEVLLQVVLGVEGSAVDPRQLLVLLVTAPVGAGETGQLDRLDRRRVLEVRATAEIGEVTLGVEGDRSLGRIDELDLVVLALRLEAPPCLVATDLLALPRASFRELPAHLLLDALERLLADRLGELEVIVEAVLDRRPDGDLDAWIEMPDGLRKEMRGRVPEHREGVGILRVARGQDLDRLAVLER